MPPQVKTHVASSISASSGLHVALVIPAHNEQGNIGGLLASLPRHIDGFGSIDPLVVDDGSTDQTLEIALEAGARVVSHRVNLGLGGALKSGTDAAIARGADVIVHMDGDGQHAPEDLPALLAPFLDTARFVTGVRDFAPPMPVAMRVGNRGIRWLMRLVLGISHPDSQCGYRAFRADVWEKLRWQSSGYAIASEILFRAKQNGIAWTAIPIKTIYLEPFKGTGPADGLAIARQLILWRLGG